jgi:hypothetical protein
MRARPAEREPTPLKKKTRSPHEAKRLVLQFCLKCRRVAFQAAGLPLPFLFARIDPNEQIAPEIQTYFKVEMALFVLSS